MAQVQPPRRRDRQPRLDHGYYDSGPPHSYGDERRRPYVTQDRPPPSRPASRRHHSEQRPPDRRSRAERPRSERPPPDRIPSELRQDDSYEPYEPRHRAPSPDYRHDYRRDTPPYRDARHAPARDEPPFPYSSSSSRAAPPSFGSGGYGRRGTRGSPPPSPYAPDGGARKRMPHPERGSYARDPHDRVPQRDYPSSPSPPSQRDRRRGSLRDEPEPRSRRQRQSPSDEPRRTPRGRSHERGGDDSDAYGRREPRGRPRSQLGSRGDGANRSPPSPQRSRPPHGSGGAGRGGPDPQRRRNSMPPSTKPKSSHWYQHPVVKAGARTALTAGAQAVMKSRAEEGAWLGPRGAKVATAALGAALVDGFIGNKHPGSNKMAKSGVDTAADRIGKHGLSKDALDLDKLSGGGGGKR